jgi:hypothetical protein
MACLLHRVSSFRIFFIRHRCQTRNFSNGLNLNLVLVRNGLAFNAAGRGPAFQISTMQPLHDYLCSSHVLPCCSSFLSHAKQQCRLHLPPLPESLCSCTVVSMDVPLLCHTTLCIYHQRLRHPPASYFLLWLAMELAGADPRTRPFPFSLFLPG